MLSYEKKTIHIYEFFFTGYDKPLVLIGQDQGKDEMAIYIATEIEKRKLNKVDLVDMRQYTPITGVTEIEENGVTLIWAGLENSETGWLTKEEFKLLKIE